MLRFEDPIYLYMLLAVPALVLLRLALWRIRKKKLIRQVEDDDRKPYRQLYQR